MSNLLSILLLAASLTASTTAAAFEKLECESANVKIVGTLQTKYLRMGHSIFNGDLTVFIYNQRRIVGSKNVKVFSGDIQDMNSIDTNMARAENGESVSLEINQDGPSTLQIGNEKTEFQPHCEIAYNQKNSVSSNLSNIRYYCSRPKPGFDCNGDVGGR